MDRILALEVLDHPIEGIYGRVLIHTFFLRRSLLGDILD